MKCWPSGPAVEKRLALALAILSAASCLLVFDGIRSLARTNNEKARVLEDFRQAVARMRNGDVVDVDLLFLNQKKEKIQRAFEELEPDFVAHFLWTLRNCG